MLGATHSARWLEFFSARVFPLLVFFPHVYRFRRLATVFPRAIFATYGSVSSLSFFCFMLLTLLCLPTPQPQFISFQLPHRKKKENLLKCVCMCLHFRFLLWGSVTRPGCVFLPLLPPFAGLNCIMHVARKFNVIYNLDDVQT